MNDPSTFERQGVFQFMALPPELRAIIYRFAIVEPHPLTLYAHLDHRSDSLKGFAVQKSLGMLETCKEFRTEMKKVLYSENSFHLRIGNFTSFKKGIKTFQIDIGRIQKCYIYVYMMTELDDHGEEDSDSDPEFLCEVEWLFEFVAALVFKGHQMKYLLVCCEGLPDESLAKGLSPLSMLRNIHLVHFRSIRDEMYPYFRFLEGLMMSDRPQLFRSINGFWKDSTCFDYDLLENPDKCWFVEGLDITARAEVQSEEQMDATAKELYSILRMERKWQPQSYLDRTCLLW